MVGEKVNFCDIAVLCYLLYNIIDWPNYYENQNLQVFGIRKVLLAIETTELQRQSE